MKRIWFDTEFIDDGRTIELLSIGLVDQYGREYYAEPLEADHSKASPWVAQNVLSHLTGIRTPRAQIAQELVEFCGPKPEFWAWFGAYDWVALCQLYGRMLDVPVGWPNLFNEVVHFAKGKYSSGYAPNFKAMFANTAPHNSLADAVWTKAVWEHVNGLGK
jgi:hypothetical protein